MTRPMSSPRDPKDDTTGETPNRSGEAVPPGARPAGTAGKPVVAIIGGGFTGATTAWNLARGGHDLRVLVFEPRPRLGAGLAYDTDEPVHRINVPATRMSIDPERPDDFANWLAETGYAATDPEAMAPDGSLFPRRQAFGTYVGARLAPFLANGAVEHIQARVTALTKADGGWELVSDDGATHLADRVIIATTHPAPTAPRLLAAMLEGHPRFIPDATVPNALAPIRSSDSVLVVGNGLTSADVIASLLSRGHRGQITSISRRGLRSRGHAATPQEPFGDFTTRPIRSARLLTRRIREAIRQADIFGASWHGVLDAARGQGRSIWANLPVAERLRLVRHLRPFWDVHRFRIAPQVEAALVDATERGQLETMAASIAAISYNAGKIRAALKRAHSAGTTIRDFDAVIVTTGPAHNAVFDSQDYLTGLADAGLALADPVRLGLWCDEHSRVLDREGWPTQGLYVAGPLARGTFGELMGLPQVSEHAGDVAAEVIASLMAQSDRNDRRADSAV